jgi:hypothetical protein
MSQLGRRHTTKRDRTNRVTRKDLGKRDEGTVIKTERKTEHTLIPGELLMGRVSPVRLVCKNDKEVRYETS